MAGNIERLRDAAMQVLMARAETAWREIEHETSVLQSRRPTTIVGSRIFCLHHVCFVHLSGLLSNALCLFLRSFEYPPAPR